MHKLVVLSGPIAAGKTSFGEALQGRFAIQKISTRKYILAHTDCAEERAALQAAGDTLDRITGGQWVADAVMEQSAGASEEELVLLVDSARIVGQVQKLREQFGSDSVRHVHLKAPEYILEARYLARSPEMREFATYAEAKQSPTEAAVGALEQVADVVIDTSTAKPPSQVAKAVEGWLTTPQHREQLVDVFVGAQYGSEGKGNVCAFVAREYGVLMRIGGPNAGHKVKEPPYKYVQLPSGTWTNPNAQVLIGAGSTILLDVLLKEIDDHPWLKHPGRLVIDRQAMVIEDDDKKLEEQLLGPISSTKQGVGAATARKVIGRGVPVPWGPPVKLAGVVAELAPYIGDTKAELDRAYLKRTRVMLEGTQGTYLSIHHGAYPKVTSRETTAAGCLSDAGISMRRVRKIFLVARTYPIRVGGESGPMGIEINWDIVAKRSGQDAVVLTKREVGTISGSPRRVAEFDWDLIRRSAEINGATDIALTFVDYLQKSNESAKDIQSLTQDTQNFVADVERVTGCPVSLISVGFGREFMIDRRYV